MTQPQRILVIGTEPAMILKFHAPLLRAMAAAGHEVHLAGSGLTTSTAGAALAEMGFCPHDFPVSRAGLNPAADLRTLAALVALMRSVRPDVVFCYTAKPVIYGLLAAAWTGVPRRFALITGLGYAFTGQARGKRRMVRAVASSLYRRALGRADRVFFQNPEDEAEFRRLAILRPDKPVSIVDGCGVDLAAFPALALAGGPITFLMVARLVGDKGVRDYAQAARIFRREQPEARFLLAGGLDPNPEGIAAEEVAAWQAAGDILWLGQLADVRPALAEAHVFVLPSHREGLPQSTLEAMATGRPILTTDAPGCRETVRDGVTGRMVPVADPTALARAMAELASDRDALARIGEAARRMAEQRFDSRKVNATLMEQMGF